jgi:hypothetical protein
MLRHTCKTTCPGCAAEAGGGTARHTCASVCGACIAAAAFAQWVKGEVATWPPLGETQLAELRALLDMSDDESRDDEHDCPPRADASDAREDEL